VWGTSLVFQTVWRYGHSFRHDSGIGQTDRRTDRRMLYVHCIYMLTCDKTEAQKQNWGNRGTVEARLHQETLITELSSLTLTLLLQSINSSCLVRDLRYCKIMFWTFFNSMKHCCRQTDGQTDRLWDKTLKQRWQSQHEADVLRNTEYRLQNFIEYASQLNAERLIGLTKDMRH